MSQRNELLFVVHSTWNESRNDEFPQILEYRQKWNELGFEVSVTPNDAIRNDIVTLDKLVPSIGLLHIFDTLATTNMKFDVWRYAKLYLEGGMYADVDVEPLTAIQQWVAVSQKHSRPVFFEESNWPSNVFTRTLIPLLSDYEHLPAYGTCVVISPGPQHELFLTLLRDVHPERWRHVKEPKRTLMSVGPGLVTEFVRTHASEVVLVSYQQRATAYVHHGFGTWKSWVPKEYYVFWSLALTACLVVIVKCSRSAVRKRGHQKVEGVQDDDLEMEEKDAAWMRRRKRTYDVL